MDEKLRKLDEDVMDLEEKILKVKEKFILDNKDEKIYKLIRPDKNDKYYLNQDAAKEYGISSTKDSKDSNKGKDKDGITNPDYQIEPMILEDMDVEDLMDLII